MPKPVQRGFSLVELMVAIVLGLFLVGGLASLLVSNVRTRAEFDRSARQIENGRFALEMLTEDIQHAGFIGMSSTSLPPPVSPNPCPANSTAMAAMYLPPPAASATNPTAIYGFAGQPGGCPANYLPHYKPNTAVLVVTRASTAAPVAPSASLSANDAFIQINSCMVGAGAITPYSVATGSNYSSLTLTQKDCTTLSTVRPLMLHVYFISTCNDCALDSTPTLKRMEFSGALNQMTPVPLVEGIEDMQLEYGVDNVSQDGSPDCYTTNPANPPAGEQCTAGANVNWANVVTVRVHLLARTVNLKQPNLATCDTGGWTDTRTYDMGWRITGPGTSASAPVGPFLDSCKRHAYSAVARVYNISGQRE